jgi:spore coat polysaccharide biosynthesis protein SpsF
MEDISQRLLESAKGADVVVQITGDCPLIDPAHIDKAIDLLRETGADYVSNNKDGLTFPLGLDVRAFTMDALQRSMALSADPTDRVHGSYFIARRPDLFRQAGWSAPPELHWPDLRLTVDEPADYEVVRRVFETLWPYNPNFDSYDIVKLLRSKPDWVALNSSVRQKNPVEG